MTEPSRHSDFEALLGQVRGQSAPPLTVEFADVQRAAVRQSSWRWGAAALAATIIGLLGWGALNPSPPEESPLAAVDPSPARAPAEVVPEASRDQSPPRVALGDGATLEPLAPERPAPERAATEVGEGRYVVRTSDDPITLPIRGRVLEIEAASEVFIDNTLEQTSFEVRAGSARWAPDAKVPKASVAELAAKAERAMIAGERGEAARALRKLARQYPASAAAKGALVDLARREKKLGRSTRAYCAYALFLERYPTDSRAPSVRTASAALDADTTKCRGLTPVER